MSEKDSLISGLLLVAKELQQKQRIKGNIQAVLLIVVLIRICIFWVCQ